MLKILRFPDEWLLYWASNQWLKKDGEIVFRNKTSSAFMKVIFKNAYCLEMHQNIGLGVETLFVISAESLFIGEELYTNNWTK